MLDEYLTFLPNVFDFGAEYASYKELTYVKGKGGGERTHSVFLAVLYITFCFLVFFFRARRGEKFQQFQKFDFAKKLSDFI